MCVYLLFLLAAAHTNGARPDRPAVQLWRMAAIFESCVACCGCLLMPCLSLTATASLWMR
jgi:hypothetical protein